jgi:fatty acid amide hydrolase 2
VYEGGSGAHRLSPYLVTGPLARSAGDLDLLLRIMAGTDGLDPNAEDIGLGNASDVDWRGRRVWLLPEPRVRLARSTAPDLAGAVSAAGRILEKRGARVEFAPRDLMRDAGDLWFPAMQSVGGTPFRELLGGGQRINVLRESAAALVGRSEYSWPALFFALAEAFGRRRDEAVQHGLSRLRQAEAGFRELVGDDGVLIAPVHPRAAPRHNAPVLHPFDFLYTAYFNALRVPATSVPFGFAASGLPLAIQVAAARGNDHLTMAAAMALEAARPPWTPARVLHGAAPEQADAVLGA